MPIFQRRIGSVADSAQSALGSLLNLPLVLLRETGLFPGRLCRFGRLARHPAIDTEAAGWLVIAGNAAWALATHRATVQRMGCAKLARQTAWRSRRSPSRVAELQYVGPAAAVSR